MKHRHAESSSSPVSSITAAVDIREVVVDVESDLVGSTEKKNQDNLQMSMIMSSSSPPSPNQKFSEAFEHSLNVTWSSTDAPVIDGVTTALTTTIPMLAEDSSLISEEGPSTLKDDESLIDRKEDHQGDDSLIDIRSDEEQETLKNLDNGDAVLGDVLELLEKSLGRRLEDQRSALPLPKSSPTPSRHRSLSSKLSGSFLSPPSFFSDMNLFRTSSPQHRDSDHPHHHEHKHDGDNDSHGSNNSARRGSSNGPLEEKENDELHISSAVDRNIGEKLTLQDFLMVSERKLPSKGNRRKKSGMNLFSKIFSNPLDDHEKYSNDEQPSIMTD